MGGQEYILEVEEPTVFVNSMDMGLKVEKVEEINEDFHVCGAPQI